MTMSFGLKSLRSRIYYFVWDSALEIPSRHRGKRRRRCRRKNVFFQLEFKFHDSIFLSLFLPRAVLVRTLQFHSIQIRAEIEYFSFVKNHFLLHLAGFSYFSSSHFSTESVFISFPRLRTFIVVVVFWQVISFNGFSIALASHSRWLQWKERRLLTLWKWKVFGIFSLDRWCWGHLRIFFGWNSPLFNFGISIHSASYSGSN